MTGTTSSGATSTRSPASRSLLCLRNPSRSLSAATRNRLCVAPPGSGTAGCTQEGDEDELVGYLKRLNEFRKEYGLEGEPFEIHVISINAFDLDGVRKLEDIGVTDAIVGCRVPYETDDIFPLDQKIEELRSFADEVIAKVG